MQITFFRGSRALGLARIVATLEQSPSFPDSVAAFTTSQTSSTCSTGTNTSHFPLLSVAFGYEPSFLQAPIQYESVISVGLQLAREASTPFTFCLRGTRTASFFLGIDGLLTGLQILQE